MSENDFFKGGALDFTPPSEQMKNTKRFYDGSTRALGQFPSDLGIHFMCFTFRRARQGRDATNMAGQALAGHCFLPIPNNLVDALAITYNDVELGVIGGGLANAVGTSRATIENAVTNTVDKAKELAEGGLSGVKDKITSTITGMSADVMGAAANWKETLQKTSEAAGDVGAILSTLFRQDTGGLATGLNRAFGGIPNPNVSALFRGVGLKNHSFEWKLAPRSEEESLSLFQIVNAFKHVALPQINNSTIHQRMTLGYPDECMIQIFGTDPIGKDIPTMIRFKPCVIKNVTVNYTPDNTLSFFRQHGWPTAVSLKLDIQETVIHTKDDYPEDMELTTASSVYASMNGISGTR